MPQPRTSIIAALGKDRAIGKNNRLLWHIPDDLKRFKALTLGHPVIMGRKTFDSIVAQLGKPLPGRTNIVVTRAGADTTNTAQETGTRFAYENVFVVHSIEEALAKAKEVDHEEVFVIGGAQIYAQALPFADRLYLTLVESDTKGDTFFPEYENVFTKNIFEEPHTDKPTPHTFVTLEK